MSETSQPAGRRADRSGRGAQPSGRRAEPSGRGAEPSGRGAEPGVVRSQGGTRRSEPVARGRRSQARSGPGPWPQVAAHGLGALLTGLAWFYLVGAATDFGVLAVRGQTPAWAFTIAASLGAVVCLLLFLVLVGRGLRTLGIVSDYKPRRAAPGRRRAS